MKILKYVFALAVLGALTSCDMILGFFGETVDNTFYVSENGKDSNNGTSEKTPFLTLDEAVDAVMDHKDDNPEQSDYYIYIYGKIYGTTTIQAQNNLHITLLGSGTIDAKGASQAVLTLTGSYTRVTLDGNITLTNSIDHGVEITNGASFTMSAGSIKDNPTLNGNTSWYNRFGGGVLVEDRGIFIMTGGTISENNAENGGGIYITKTGTFSMYGGSITNNTADSRYETAGGVHNEGGTFIQSGGTVTGNIITQNIGNTDIYEKN